MKIKENSVLKVFIVILIVFIVVLALTTLLNNASSKKNNKEIEIKSKFNKPGWIYNEYYKYGEHFMTSVKKYKDLEFKNARIRVYDDCFTLKIDVTNASDEDVYHKAATVILLDENKNKITEAIVPLVDIKSGNTELDIYNRYPPADNMNNIVDYIVEDGELEYIFE